MEQKKLVECLSVKSKNLDFIKFVASILVIYSHAYDICGYSEREVIKIFSGGGELTLGGVAVAFFLFVSGLYVTKSLKNSTTKEYIKKRIVRIFPCFIIVILLTVFVIGALVTTLDLKTYFTSFETYEYLRYIILWPIYGLPGVFLENPISNINGSLWTIVLECLCYIALLIFYKCKMLNKKFMKCILPLAFVIMSFIFILKPEFLYQFSAYIRPLFLFFVGVIYYVFSDRIILKWDWCIIALAVLILCGWSGYLNVAIIIVLPYIVCTIAYSKVQCPDWMAKLGNYSYCIYLVAFPIQQMVWQYFDGIGRTVLGNTMISIVLTYITGVFMYYLIEKPVVKIFSKRNIV